MLLDSCIEDARIQNMLGVAVVTRKGTWMASKDLFLKNNFEIADTAKPDFELMYKSFDKKTKVPKFNIKLNANLNKYKNGLVIISSDQCPYIVKAINEISETSVNEYKIKPQIVELKTIKMLKIVHVYLVHFV